MLLTLDLTSELPIYQQLRDRIVEAIADGVLPAGSRLPATRQLAADLGVNFHTVNKAYDLLRREGLLRLTRKAGAVVHRDAASGPAAAGLADSWEARARTLLAEAVAQGMSQRETMRRCQTLLAGFAARPHGPQRNRGAARG